MGEECSYSYWDLFEEAYRRPPTDDERAKFFAASQDERNLHVKNWAKKAGWGIEDRIGSDGLIYTAFCPLWSTGK